MSQVAVDPTDANQAGVQQAAAARVAARHEFWSQVRSAGFETVALIGEVILLGPACATILGCAADSAALVATGALLAETGNSIVVNGQAFDTATAQANYFHCRMAGGSDSQCRPPATILDGSDGGGAE